MCVSDDTNDVHSSSVDTWCAGADDVLISVDRVRTDERFDGELLIGDLYAQLTLSNLICAVPGTDGKVPVEADVQLSVHDCRRLAADLLEAADRIEREAAGEPGHAVPARGLTVAQQAALYEEKAGSIARLGDVLGIAAFG